MNAEKWLELLEKGRYNQRLFQPQTLCLILRVKSATKQEIADHLEKQNPEIKNYNWRSCPVFKVLLGKKMLKIQNDNYRISVNLSSSQTIQAKKICLEILK